MFHSWANLEGGHTTIPPAAVPTTASNSQATIPLSNSHPRENRTDFDSVAKHINLGSDKKPNTATTAMPKPPQNPVGPPAIDSPGARPPVRPKGNPPRRVPLPGSPIRAARAQALTARVTKSSKSVARSASSIDKERLSSLTNQLRDVQESIKQDLFTIRSLTRDDSLPEAAVTTLEMMEGGLEATEIEIQRIATELLREANKENVMGSQIAAER